MKDVFVFLSIIIFASACTISNEKDKQSSEATKAQDSPQQNMQNLMAKEAAAESLPEPDYKKIPIHVRYAAHPELSEMPQDSLPGKNPEAYQMYFLKRKQFLLKAIPAAKEVDALKWEQGMTWQKADSIYRNFLTEHENHPWINIFRQNGAYVILVRLDLLKETNPAAQEKIAYYLKQLNLGESTNLQLINYGLQQLKGHYPQKDLRAIAKKTLVALNKYQVISNLEKATQKRIKEYKAEHGKLDDKVQEEIRLFKDNMNQMKNEKSKLEAFVS